MSQAAFAADADPTARSAGQGQLINLDLLDLDLASLGFTQTSFPAKPGPDTGQLDLGVLGNETIRLGDGLQLPLLKNAQGQGLIHLGELGAASSYSESLSDASSKASSGVLGSGGSIAVSPNTGVGTDPAYVDLTDLLDQLNVSGLTDSVLDQARVELGSLATSAESASDVVTSEYVLAGANITVRSPLVGTIATNLGGVVQTAVQPVNDLVESDGALNKLLTTLKDALNGFDLGVAKIKVGAATVAIDGIDTVGASVVEQLISTPIANNSGSVSIDLGTGEVTLDVAKLIKEADGSDVNSLPANYNVVSAEFVQAVTTGITESLAGITTKVTTILNSVLNNLAVSLDVQVEACAVLCLADGGVKVAGTLAQFAGTDPTPPKLTTTLKIAGLVDVGALLNPVLTIVLNTITTVTGPTIQGVLNTVSAGLGNVINPVVKAVTDPLEPVLRGVLDQLVTLRINEQPTAVPVNGDGDLGVGSFTVRAISLGLLPAAGGEGIAKLSLASSTVRAAVEDDNGNVNASASAAASANADDESNASAQAAAQAAADADANSTASAAADADATAAASAAATADASADASQDVDADANASAAAASSASADSTADAAQDADASAAANANASAAASAAAEADASTDADASASAAAQAAAEADASTDASTEAAAAADASASASSNADADADNNGEADSGRNVEGAADDSGNVNASATAAASANADDESNASAQAAAQAAADADANSTASAAADADATAAASAAATADASADASQDVDADANASAAAASSASADSTADAAQDADASAAANANASAAASAAAKASASANASASSAGNGNASGKPALANSGSDANVWLFAGVGLLLIVAGGTAVALRSSSRFSARS
ncbi:hypothetical protein D3229_08515 [Leucobacter aridicollis]|nr:hypothetical protein [Leucobacter aridicollis]